MTTESISTPKACSDCPFKIGSGTTYDQDAIEALEMDCTPSCHKKVGAKAIFHDPFPGARKVCGGFINWINEVDGFSTPALTIK